MSSKDRMQGSAIHFTQKISWESLRTPFALAKWLEWRKEGWPSGTWGYLDALGIWHDPTHKECNMDVHVMFPSNVFAWAITFPMCMMHVITFRLIAAKHVTVFDGEIWAPDTVRQHVLFCGHDRAKKMAAHWAMWVMDPSFGWIQAGGAHDTI